MYLTTYVKRTYVRFPRSYKCSLPDKLSQLRTGYIRSIVRAAPDRSRQGYIRSFWTFRESRDPKMSNVRTKNEHAYDVSGGIVAEPQSNTRTRFADWAKFCVLSVGTPFRHRCPIFAIAPRTDERRHQWWDAGTNRRRGTLARLPLERFRLCYKPSEPP